MKNILITGGAGYIGRQISNVLNKNLNYKISVIDNLSATKKNYLKKKINFQKLNILDEKKLDNYFKKNSFDIVIHLAAKCIVSEGEKKKRDYFKTNVLGTKNILNCCKKNSIKNFIFASSCSIFSNKIRIVSENSVTNPISYYGKTKLICEKMIKKELGNKTRFIILRYFNVVGGDIKNNVGEFITKDRIFNNFSQKILLNKPIEIYGNDYKTKDGTCVRDYIHVNDLAEIHKLLIDNIDNLKNRNVINCSYGKGYSVLEIAKCFLKKNNNKSFIIFKKKRNGDMKEILSTNKKLKKIINFKPKYINLDKMVKSSYKWTKSINKNLMS